LPLFHNMHWPEMRSCWKEANNIPRDGYFIRPMLSSFTQIFHIIICESAMQLFHGGPHPHNSKQQNYYLESVKKFVPVS
jgi:hypothetical protein